MNTNDWTMLEKEYDAWQNKMDEENLALRDNIQSETVQLQSLRKSKVEIEKVNITLIQGRFV